MRWILRLILFASMLAVGTATSNAWEPRVVGTGELVIIHAKADKEPLTNEKPEEDLTTQQVEDKITAAMEQPKIYHVHANYFRRPIEFQRELMPEGPVVVVARHPICKRRCMSRFCCQPARRSQADQLESSL